VHNLCNPLGLSCYWKRLLLSNIFADAQLERDLRDIAVVKRLGCANRESVGGLQAQISSCGSKGVVSSLAGVAAVLLHFLQHLQQNTSIKSVFSAVVIFPSL